MSDEERRGYRSEFPEYYAKHLIPCRINHKTSSLSLTWDQPFIKLDLTFLTKICFHGIKERLHPYKFIARQASKELLKTPNILEKIRPILYDLFCEIRKLFLTRDEETFYDTCAICQLLIKACGKLGGKYIYLLLQSMQKRLLMNNYA